MPWIAMFIPEKRISRGRISRSSTRVTLPSSIQARPTEQALPRCSFAVSKSIAMVFKISNPNRFFGNRNTAPLPAAQIRHDARLTF
jgi:hypothetical protein